MAEAIFWLSFAFIGYVYFGYPLLLSALRRLLRRPIQKGDWEPTISMVIAAHNEKDTIAAKIRNCLQLDYPVAKLEMIVSLDGSTDGTDRIARQYENGRIRVFHSPRHRGKAAALNRGAAAARGELIVFADARQHIHRRALRELAANFRDSSVGAVSGEMILVERGQKEDADVLHPMGLYWRYEKWLRAMESDIGSTVGATGALYAIRRELFQPLPERIILDDVLIPMRIAIGGKRVIFEPAARAYDQVACCPEAEFRRKVRTLAGNYQLVALMPGLLFPWRNPVFFQFVSHKMGRLLVPYFLAMLFFSNCFLLHGFYWVPFAAQWIWYLLALGGYLTAGSERAEHAHEQAAFRRNWGILK